MSENSRPAHMRLRVHQRVTDPDTPGVWRIGALGSRRTRNLRPGHALLFPADADAELYLLLQNTERGWEKIIRFTEALTPTPSPPERQEKLPGL